MKQILQDLKKGDTHVEDVPVPGVKPGHLLIATTSSLVSAGTERMLMEFGQANLIDKARQQPDKVRMVLDKVKTDGLGPTLESVRAKLDQPLPMGYSNVGVVLEVGAGVSGFEVGDRVVSNGNHAEVVCVPKNLCAKIPDDVSDEMAAFTVLGSIALQGVRLVAPTLGENIVVTGLGLIGLVTVQILRANGCNVLGIDPDPAKAELARQFGATTVDLSAGEDPLEAARAFTNGIGVDGVIITASTKSDEPVHIAAEMCRQRGRIVLVGVVGLKLSRADFYEKELSFQVSCSYGPGRYDSFYEEQGNDYPVGFVRWTEQRNFEAVLGLMNDGRIDIDPLVSHRFPIGDAVEAYRVLGEENPLGIVLEYPEPEGGMAKRLEVRTVELTGSGAGTSGQPAVSVIGSGNYATQILIPAFQAGGANLRSLASAKGVSSVHAGKKYDFDQVTTDPDALIADDSVDAVVVATRHDTHADYSVKILDAGKHLFVEKPLAVTREEAAQVTAAIDAQVAEGKQPIVMVGFNRRFSPLVEKMHSLLAARSEPKSFVMTVNAGEIPPDHWVHDPVQGGGRIIGEACHFVDLIRFLAGSKISSVTAVMMGEAPGVAVREDKASITVTFEDGSFGVVHYLANGDKSFPKERLEVFCGGSVLQLDNFRRLNGFGWPGFKGMKLRRQDKGNAACAKAFVEAVRRGGPSPIPYEEIAEVTEAIFAAVDSMNGATD